eukprot:Clim_evm28s148 gene=Clim_evmTU28s148
MQHTRFEVRAIEETVAARPQWLTDLTSQRTPNRPAKAVFAAIGQVVYRDPGKTPQRIYPQWKEDKLSTFQLKNIKSTAAAMRASETMQAQRNEEALECSRDRSNSDEDQLESVIDKTSREVPETTYGSTIKVPMTVDCVEDMINVLRQTAEENPIFDLPYQTPRRANSKVGRILDVEKVKSLEDPLRETRGWVRELCQSKDVLDYGSYSAVVKSGADLKKAGLLDHDTSLMFARKLMQRFYNQQAVSHDSWYKRESYWMELRDHLKVLLGPHLHELDADSIVLAFRFSVVSGMTDADIFRSTCLQEVHQKIFFLSAYQLGIVGLCIEDNVSARSTLWYATEILNRLPRHNDFALVGALVSSFMHACRYPDRHDTFLRIMDHQAVSTSIWDMIANSDKAGFQWWTQMSIAQMCHLTAFLSMQKAVQVQQYRLLSKTYETLRHVSARLPQTVYADASLSLFVACGHVLDNAQGVTKVADALADRWLNGHVDIASNALELLSATIDLPGRKTQALAQEAMMQLVDEDRHGRLVVNKTTLSKLVSRDISALGDMAPRLQELYPREWGVLKKYLETQVFEYPRRDPVLASALHFSERLFVAEGGQHPEISNTEATAVKLALANSSMTHSAALARGTAALLSVVRAGAVLRGNEEAARMQAVNGITETLRAVTSRVAKHRPYVICDHMTPAFTNQDLHQLHIHVNLFGNAEIARLFDQNIVNATKFITLGSQQARDLWVPEQYEAYAEQLGAMAYRPGKETRISPVAASAMSHGSANSLSLTRHKEIIDDMGRMLEDLFAEDAKFALRLQDRSTGYYIVDAALKESKLAILVYHGRPDLRFLLKVKHLMAMNWSIMILPPRDSQNMHRMMAVLLSGTTNLSLRTRPSLFATPTFESLMRSTSVAAVDPTFESPLYSQRGWDDFQKKYKRKTKTL